MTENSILSSSSLHERKSSRTSSLLENQTIVKMLFVRKIARIITQKNTCFLLYAMNNIRLQKQNKRFQLKLETVNQLFRRIQLQMENKMNQRKSNFLRLLQKISWLQKGGEACKRIIKKKYWFKIQKFTGNYNIIEKCVYQLQKLLLNSSYKMIKVNLFLIKFQSASNRVQNRVKFGILKKKWIKSRQAQVIAGIFDQIKQKIKKYFFINLRSCYLQKALSIMFNFKIIKQRANGLQQFKYKCLFLFKLMNKCKFKPALIFTKKQIGFNRIKANMQRQRNNSEALLKLSIKLMALSKSKINQHTLFGIILLKDYSFKRKRQASLNRAQQLIKQCFSRTVKLCLSLTFTILKTHDYKRTGQCLLEIKFNLLPSNCQMQALDVPCLEMRERQRRQKPTRIHMRHATRRSALNPESVEQQISKEMDLSRSTVSVSSLSIRMLKLYN